MQQSQRHPEDIMNELLVNKGVFDTVFGKLLPGLVYSQAVEHDRLILEKVFEFEDVRDIFPRPIDRSQFKKLAQIVFRYQEQHQPLLSTK